MAKEKYPAVKRPAEPRVMPTRKPLTGSADFAQKGPEWQAAVQREAVAWRVNRHLGDGRSEMFGPTADLRMALIMAVQAHDANQRPALYCINDKGHASLLPQKDWLAYFNAWKDTHGASAPKNEARKARKG